MILVGFPWLLMNWNINNTAQLLIWEDNVKFEVTKELIFMNSVHGITKTIFTKSWENT